MKSRELKIRMWPGVSKSTMPRSPPPRAKKSSDKQPQERGTRRSRLGCTECKRRHVKCDEAFPVCLRCQKRGALCESAPRLTRWQMVSPWTNLSSNSQDSVLGLPKPSVETSKPDDTALMQYWLERASQIMVVDPEVNPLSFPILEYLDKSPSLKHALQSVGAAHRQYFDPEKLSEYYKERSSATNLIIGELSSPDDRLLPVFLSLLLLGLSTAWTSAPTANFGQQYLHGAHGLVEKLLNDSESLSERPPYFNFMLGAYLYWDMATAFLVPTMDPERPPVNTNAAHSAVMEMGHLYHPMTGYSTGIFYFLGNIGRYCRSVVETSLRDEHMEAVLEGELNKWEPNRDSPELRIMSDAFRSHGLISLAAICYRRPGHTAPNREHSALSSYLSNPEPMEAIQWLTAVEPYYFARDLETAIRNIALTTIKELASIPSTHPCINAQGIPLFTAASELMKEDKRERQMVRQRFKELYSLNHLRGNLDALQLLSEIWKRRDRGERTSWLDVMIDMGWNMMLG